MSEVRAAGVWRFLWALKLGEKAVKLDGSKAPYHAYYAEQLGESAERASMFKAIGIARSVRKELGAALCDRSE